MPYDETPVQDAAEAATDDDAIITLALERFDMCAKAENEFRKKALDDLNFYAGDQWPKDISDQRVLDKRPQLIINRLPQFVHQVSNDIRQNKPAPKVSPITEGATQETAEIIQGIIRHIGQQSSAEAVRSYAALYQVISGRGYYRILTRRVDPFSKDQELFLQRIKNPATVYMDPTAQEPDRCDAKWGFIIEDLTRDEFKVAYPNAQLSSAEEFRSTGDGAKDWASQDSIRIAEYFTRDVESMDVALLDDGSIVPVDKVLPGSNVIGTQVAEVPRVKWRKITCFEILEERDWPGQWIPIVPVLGEELDIDGKQDLIGMVRNAKDPQRMLNYWESAKTETIALAPRAPFIVAEGQVENHEEEWKQANVRNYAYLTYKPRTVGQELVAAPQRQVYEPPIQAITVAEGAAVEHLKATTGIYDASLGNRSNEISGVAIRQRESQGDVANYHFIDNLNVAITHEARMLVDLIPKIYDRPGRVMRIVGEDGTDRQVTLNAVHTDQSGVQKYYDLRLGRYDVVVDIGPSYKTKREASLDSMMQFAQAAPMLLPRFADLMVQAADWPMAKEIADRVRPPDVPGPGQKSPIPPEAQAQMQQLQQENAMLQQALDQANLLLNNKAMEIESKERMQARDNASEQWIQTMKTQADLIQKGVDTGSRESIALLQADIAMLTKHLDILQAKQKLAAAAEAAQQRNTAPPGGALPQ